MGRKSFNNLLFDLKEAKTVEDKKQAFKAYLYGNGLIELINNSDNKIKKTIYHNDLYSKIELLSDNNKIIINNIINDIYNHQKTVINNEIKSLMINVFNIRKSSEIKNIVFFYYWFNDFICYNRNKYIESFGDYDFYISLALPKNRRDELALNGITKIKDLKDIFLNDIEIDNINQYIFECSNYKINDKLFCSLFSEDIRFVIKAYNKLKSFNKVSKEINISPTNARMKYNYGIKKVLDFFCTKDGTTALRLIFKDDNGKISRTKLNDIFTEYGLFLTDIFIKGLVYKIKYDEESDCFIAL